MKTKLFLFIAFFGFVVIGLTQNQNIQIGGMWNEWPNEPSICMNPSNPDEIIIGTNANNYYTSEDGGATWQPGTISSSYGVNGDPVILAGNEGSFYYLHLVPDLSRVVCQKKTSLQSEWSDGSYTAVYNDYDIDKEWATFDPVTGNLYASWTRFNTWGSSNPQDSTDIFLAKSTDGGLTWGEQKLISNIGGNATGGNGSVHGSCPATGTNGEVYVVWWSPSGLMFDRSLDQGETWLDTDINVTGFPVQWIVNLPGIQTGVSFPIIACDRSSGPNHGTIYVNWTDKRSGNNDANIWLAKSTDGGDTWSAPIRVNNDPPGRHQFFNHLTIDQVTGKIYVIFYDRRNYTDTNTDVYLAISDDGGETFTNQKLSETPFLPYSTMFFGHYIGISAHNDNVFATWMRMDDGTLSIWGTKVDPAPVGVDFQPCIPYSFVQNIPNPFKEHTIFSFRLRKPSLVTLRVSDLFGNEVALLINHQYFEAGKHVVQFSPEKYHLPSGVYHYSLITDQGTITRKMIYAR